MNAAKAKQIATEVKFIEEDYLRIMSLIEEAAKRGEYSLYVNEVISLSTKHALEMEGFECFYPRRFKKTHISWK